MSQERARPGLIRPAPRFSILLPTHNRADVLPFAIRSALWQTERDFELLIAGDGCTDGTADVVASFDDPRIRWFDLPKAPGIGYANRNVTLREARGEYVAYLAHDDIWFPDHLVRVGECFGQPQVELAYSRGLGVALDGRIMPYWYNLDVPSHRSGLWRGESAITMCTVVHRRRCLARYGYWDERLLRGADIEFWHRIAAGGGFTNVAFVPEPTSLHFVAKWRDTRRQRARNRLAGSLVEGFLDARLPGALRVPVDDERRTQQEATWQDLEADPWARIRELRKAVVEFQDALLWPSRSPAGLAGLRAGLWFGEVLDRTARGLLWLASAERRRLFRTLRAKTRPLAPGPRDSAGRPAPTRGDQAVD